MILGIVQKNIRWYMQLKNCNDSDFEQVNFAKREDPKSWNCEGQAVQTHRPLSFFDSFAHTTQLFIFIPIVLLGAVPIKGPFDQHISFPILINTFNAFWCWNYFLGAPMVEISQYAILENLASGLIYAIFIYAFESIKHAQLTDCKCIIPYWYVHKLCNNIFTTTVSLLGGIVFQW